MLHHNYIRYVIAVALFIALSMMYVNIEFWWAPVIVLLVTMAYLTYGSFVLSSGIYLSAITHLPNRNEKKILLTFDDGPDPEMTTKVLSVLKKHNIKAIFFCIGSKIKEHPELVKAIHDDGHWIGNHSYHHSWDITFSTLAEISREISDTEQAIEQVVGFSRKLYRPPYGVTNPFIAKALSIEGMKVMGWSFRSFDTIRSVEEVLKSKKGKYSNGEIFLLHDPLKQSAELLEALILQAKSEGYEATGLTEL